MKVHEVRRHIDHVEGLRGVISAMRSISALRVDQARLAINAIREHADVVVDALSGALPLLGLADVPPDELLEDIGERHVIVYCSEHGFSGKFNSRMLDRAEREARSSPGARLGVVGARGIRLAASRDLDVAWSTRMATHTKSLGDTALEIERAAFGRFDPTAVARIDVLYAKKLRGGSFRPVLNTLFPLDLDRFRLDHDGRVPAHDLAAPELVARLVTEFVLVELTRVTMESFLAENTSRLQSMHAAQDNLDDELRALHQQESQLRQSDITEEIFDIVGGYEALRRG